MEHNIVKLGHKKRIALVAHDNKKQDLLEWARWNIPAACNRASGNFMISSTLMTGEYERLITDHEGYRQRQVEGLVGARLEEPPASLDVSVAELQVVPMPEILAEPERLAAAMDHV